MRREGNIGVAPRDLYIFIIMGLIGVTLLEVLTMYSIHYTTLANASLLSVAPWPIFAALFAPLFVKEKLTLRVVVGGTLALIGVVFIISGGEQSLDFNSKYMMGNFLALSVSAMGAIYNLLIVRLMKKYSVLRVTTWAILFGTLFMFPLTWGQWSQIQWSDVPLMAWGSVVYNFVMCTIVAFIVWNLCMKYVGATKANFYRYLTPATATVAGALFFNESIALLQIVGAIIIVIGLIWISRDKLSASGTEQT